MDCTETAAPPPMVTDPTRTGLVFLRLIMTIRNLTI
jgi:hypothetical protein